MPKDVDPYAGTPAPGGLGDATKVRAQLDALFVAAPSVRVYHSGAQVITTGGSGTILAFNSERYDNDTIHDTSTNNSRLTCKTAGVYLITATIGWQVAGLSNTRFVELVLNGTTSIARDRRTAADDTEQTVTTSYKLAVNDYVEVRVFQNSGGSVSVAAVANFTPEFGMTWVSPG